MEEKILQVDEDNAYSRLDVFLSSKCDKSRSYIIKAIKEGNVKVNGKAILKPSFIVNNNDEVSFVLLEEKPLDIISKDIKLDIIYEDDDLLVINKPRGMVVHPSNGHYDGDTLVNALLHSVKNLSSRKAANRSPP